VARSPFFRKLVRLFRQAQTLNQPVHPTTNHQTSRSLSRRRFLRFSALAGTTAITTATVAKLADKRAMSNPFPVSRTRIAIIGGGIAGLNAAYQLKKLGLMATVYEAKPDVGGRIQSRTSLVTDGLTNDLGGSFINSDHEDMLALVDEFGLELFSRFEQTDLSLFPETAYYFGDRRIPEAEVAENLRLLAAQIGDDAALLDEDFDTYAEVFDMLSVADYLNMHQDKIPVPYVRTLVETGIRSEYGVEPEESSALQLLYNLPTVDGNTVEPLSSDELFYVKDGSGKVIERLAEALEGQIYPQWQLRQVWEQEGGYQLTFDRGRGNFAVVEADYVILATPFRALRTVDLRVELPETLRRFINEVDLGKNEKLFAGFRDRRWKQDTGFALDAWTDFGFAQMWEDTQRQPESQEGVLTFFLGGREVASSRTGAYTQGQQFIARLNDLLPGLSEVKQDTFYRTDWANDPYIGGGYTNFKPGQYLEFSEFLYIESDDPEERVDVYVGNLVFAGEHLSDEYYGYMNGAAQTGRLAAEVVAGLIQANTDYWGWVHQL